MKKNLSLFCLVGMGFAPCVAQNFIYHSDSPFGIQIVRPDTTRGAQTIFFYDYDSDGDLDMFVTGLDYFDDVPDLLQWQNIHFFIEWQENIGDARNPLFAEREEIFPDFPYPTGYFFPTVGDLDNDNDADFIVGAEIDWIGNEKLLMLNNTGLSGKDQFDVTTLDAMGLDDFVPESLYKPHLTDLDRDGDLDLMASGFDSAFGEEDGPDTPVFIYARNIGTKNAPNFQGWYGYPYDIYPSPYGELITGGDIDNDGDEDFVGALINTPPDSIGYLVVHLNTPGTDGRPAFGLPLHSPFGMPTTFGEVLLTFPTLADVDGDGDLDLFVFRTDSDGASLQYYENTLCQPVIEEVSLTICDGDVALIGDEIFTESGEYVISLKSSNGCDSTVILFLEVEEVDVSVEVNENVLTANEPGGTYQWFDCDSGANIPGATNQTYVVLATGNYAVNITDALGCLAISECVHVIITGTAEVALSKGITIYPNPTSGLTYILNDTPFPVSVLTVTNLSGQAMCEFHLNDKNSFDISFLVKGIYFVKMKINGLEVIKKLIII